MGNRHVTDGLLDFGQRKDLFHQLCHFGACEIFDLRGKALNRAAQIAKAVGALGAFAFLQKLLSVLKTVELVPAIRQALDQALSFTGDIDTALVATILDRVVVRKESTKDDIHLDVFLKLGSTYEAVYTPLKHTAGITSLKTDNARGDFLRRTEEMILSVCFGQIAGIY